MAEAPARYCSNCGQELGEGVRFCSNCGQAVNGAAKDAPETKSREPLLEVKNSALIGGYPKATIVAYQDRIKLWVKHRFAMPKEITLRYAQIAGVNVGPGIAYATLSIETTGGAVHKIKGVPKEDASQINDLITERL